MKLKKITVDLNRDGIKDRITAKCSTTNKQETCTATQVELGLSDGRFLKLYNEGAQSNYAKGESLFLSPQYIYDEAKGRGPVVVAPGAIIGRVMSRLSRGQSPDKVRIGFHRFMAKKNLVTADAVRADIHKLTSPFAVHRDTGFAHVFYYRGRKSFAQNNALSDLRRDSGDYKLRENVLIAVKKGTSEDLQEYIYAHLEGVINDEQLAAVLTQNWKALRIADMRFPVDRVMSSVIMRADIKRYITQNAATLFSMDSAQMMAQLRMALGLTDAEEKELLPKIAYVHRLVSYNPVTAIEELALTEPKLLAKVVGGTGFPKSATEFRRLLGTAISSRVLRSLLAAQLSPHQRRAFFSKIVKNDIRNRLMIRSFQMKFPGEYVVWAAELLDAWKRQARGLFGGSEVQLAAKLIDTSLNNPRVLKLLVKALLAASHVAGKPVPKYQVVLNKAIAQLLLKVPAQYLPSSDEMVMLARRYRDLIPALVIPLSKKGAPSEKAKTWARTMITTSLTPMERIAVAYVLDKEGVPHLVKLTESRDAKTVEKAYHALSSLKVSTPAVIEAFKRGLAKINVDHRIRFNMAAQLKGWKVVEIADILFKQLKRYHQELASVPKPQRFVMADTTPRVPTSGLAMRGLKPHRCIPTPDEAARYATAIEKLKTQFGFDLAGGADAKGNAYATLTQLTLETIGVFGRPAGALNFVRKTLNTTTVDLDLMLAAQALVKLRGADGLKEIFRRIRKGPVPNDLIVFAAGKVAELKTKRLAPLAYMGLFHGDANVRHTVAMNLKVLDDQRVVYAAIRDSKHASPTVRMRMAEALGIFGGRAAMARLHQMLKDADAGVRYAVKELMGRRPVAGRRGNVTYANLH